MKSNTIIMAICFVTLIIHWTSDAFPLGIVPAAVCGSWLILSALGFFRREEARAKADGTEDVLSERQQNFKDKLRQSAETAYDPTSEELATKILLINEDGSKSFITITDSGVVSTEGNPDPTIVEAVKQMRKAVLANGPDAIMAEIKKQISKIEGEKP